GGAAHQGTRRCETQVDRVKRYGLHPEVYGDLEAIHGYIEPFNPAAADRILDEFLAAFDLLAQFSPPGPFQTRPHFKATALQGPGELPDRVRVPANSALDRRRSRRTSQS